MRTAFRLLWLLVCLDLAVFWIRSYWVADVWSQTIITDTTDPQAPFVKQVTSFGTQQGEIVGQRSVGYVKDAGRSSDWEWTNPAFDELHYGPSFLNRRGFAINTQQVPGYSSVQVLLPIWNVLVLMMLMPVYWLYPVIRRKITSGRVASGVR
jgi:hypothetical protein